MDIRMLRYFLAVAQEGNITRAAESLHIAQPSLSKQLMELEKNLGKQLLIRGKRRIELTEDGLLLCKRAEEIVDLLDKTEQELTSDSTAICGVVTIGGAIPSSVLQAAAALRQQHSGVQFQFYSGDAHAVEERLEHGSLDFAVFLAPIENEKYHAIVLKDSAQWGLLVAAESALAHKKAISKADLCQTPLVLHSRTGLQQVIAQWAGIQLEQLPIAATYNIAHGDPERFVTSGLGSLLITREQLAQHLDADVRFCPLSPALSVQYALVWKRSMPLTKAAQTFLDLMRSESSKICQASGL